MEKKAHIAEILIGPSGGKIAPFYTLRHSLNNMAFLKHFKKYLLFHTTSRKRMPENKSLQNCTLLTRLT